MNDLVEIGAYATAFEADAAAAHLESEGIQASVVTDDAGGTIPSMSVLTGGARLIVAYQDAGQAAEILARRFGTDEAGEPQGG